MWTALESVFNEIENETGIGFARQGSYAEDAELPTSFFTFWNQSTDFDGFYSNKPTRCNWEWLVFYYTSDASTLYSGLENFIAKALDKGFTVEGKGRDLTCDEPNYFGRYVKVQYIENLS